MPEASLLIIFGTSFAVGFSGAMIPGPLFAATIPQAAQRGFWVGPAVVLGHAVVEVTMVIILAAGLSLLSWPQVVVGIGIVGGIVLVIMGLDMMRRALTSGDPPSLSVTGSRRPRLGVVLTGAVLSLANPSWFVWWLTIGATYILWAQAAGFWGLLSFYGGHILSDLSWYSLVALAAARGVRLMRPGLYRGVLAACGFFLLALGGFFIVEALRGGFRPP